jgi:hypothetical protein
MQIDKKSIDKNININDIDKIDNDICNIDKEEKLNVNNLYLTLLYSFLLSYMILFFLILF